MNAWEGAPIRDNHSNHIVVVVVVADVPVVHCRGTDIPLNTEDKEEKSTLNYIVLIKREQEIK